MCGVFGMLDFFPLYPLPQLLPDLPNFPTHPGFMFSPFSKIKTYKPMKVQIETKINQTNCYKTTPPPPQKKILTKISLSSFGVVYYSLAWGLFWSVDDIPCEGNSLGENWFLLCQIYPLHSFTVNCGTQFSLLVLGCYIL